MRWWTGVERSGGHRRCSLARFTLAYWCVLIARAAAHRLRRAWPSRAVRQAAKQGGYDNSDPRGWLARQTDWRARANAAQANSFEALPFFIGAVIIAHQLGAPQTRLDLWPLSS